MCCGNGLRPDVWNDFKTRFRIPQILEFYAATEGNVSIYNVEGRAGSIGRIPPFIAHRMSLTLVQFDFERELPLRNSDGFCIGCAPNEVGEAIGKISNDPSNLGAAFEGYSTSGDTEEKILRYVFEKDDVWFRTGDLMRKDERGYFYFVDRAGDTFRWKGENVSSLEVSESIMAFPSIKEANVYGVKVPKADGRAGMAVLVLREGFDLDEFTKYLVKQLPDYARPMFLRICNEIETTTTFKQKKIDLVKQAYDPTITSDCIYFNNPSQGAFVRLDKELYDRIQSGDLRI
jgi:fatty-acyl-CoA synthase